MKAFALCLENSHLYFQFQVRAFYWEVLLHCPIFCRLRDKFLSKDLKTLQKLQKNLSVEVISVYM